MINFLESWPYLTWAAGIAATFYIVTVFAVSHLHPDKKANLSLWLQGDYQGTWSEQFCHVLDSIFGENHLSIRCLMLSSIASALSVLSLWFLLDQILGLISIRSDTGLSLVQVISFGIVINIVPDFISLYETRWLIKQFARVQHPIGQIVILFLDAVVTGLIIFISISVFLWLSGENQVSLVEMVALFSIYAVFFYSTFLSSLWAWAYCISSWIARVSFRFRNYLDLKESPDKTLALIGSTMVFIVSLAIKPIITLDHDGRSSFDDFLCLAFPSSACIHVARLTDDEQQKLLYLSKACIGGVTRECLSTGLALHQTNPNQALPLFQRSCERGVWEGCNYLGFMYEDGFVVNQNYVEAAKLYKTACDTGLPSGCSNLGILYKEGLGLSQDFDLAVELFTYACDKGDMPSCSNLGFMTQNGFGVEKDLRLAAKLFKKACETGATEACANLGVMYRNGLGVEQDFAQAVKLYKQGCDAGNMGGCNNLGFMYKNGLGVQQNIQHAANFYTRACNGGSATGCANLKQLRQKNQ